MMSNDIYLAPDFKEHPDYWEKENNSDNSCNKNCIKCKYSSTDKDGKIWCEKFKNWV